MEVIITNVNTHSNVTVFADDYKFIGGIDTNSENDGYDINLNIEYTGDSSSNINVGSLSCHHPSTNDFNTQISKNMYINPTHYDAVYALIPDVENAIIAQVIVD